MYKELTIIFLVIIIFIILLSLGLLYNKFYNFDKSGVLLNFNSERLEDINFKTGDVLLFNHNFKVQAFKSIANLRFGHFGIVAKIDGKLYSIESVGSFTAQEYNLPDSQTYAFPLIERLKYYNGSVFIVKLNRPFDEEYKNRLITELKKIQKFDNNFMLSYAKYCYLNIKPANLHSMAHCAYAVGKALKNAGLLDMSDKEIYCKFPREIYNELNLKDSLYKYEKPIRILV